MSAVRWKFATVLFFLLLSLFCTVRAIHPNRWSAWAMGDAQTLLAARNWQKAGFLATHFLWVPQGYSTIAPLFDFKELNHHAHGHRGEFSGQPDNRRIYTHYPSWYAVPYGLFAKLSLYSKSVYQLFALTLSLLGLFFFYLFLAQEFDRKIALVAVATYGVSRGFLDYCDSLANMPIDDLCRFLFLFSFSRWVRSSRSSFYAIASVSYFGASLTSIDSILFIFAWAILYYGLFAEKPRRFVPVVSLGFLPLLALGIHLFQNVSYLGLSRALEDWSATLTIHARTTEGIGLWNVIKVTLESTSRSELWILVIVTGLTLRLNQTFGDKLWKNLAALGIAGLAYALVFSEKAIFMSYEIRQAAPWMTLLYASLAVGVARESRYWLTVRPVKWKILLFALLSWGACLHSYRRVVTEDFASKVDYPPSRRNLSVELEQFLAEANRLTPGEDVVFQLGSLFPKVNDYAGTMDKEPTHYPQVEPRIEYFANAPVLSAPTTQTLLRDFEFIKSKAALPLNVLVYFNPADQKPLVHSLKDKGIPFSPLPNRLETDEYRIQGILIKVGDSG